MSKTLLVIGREYLTRVRKPSFWLLTVLVPVLFAALYAIPIYLALKPAERSVVLVADESGLFGAAQRQPIQLDRQHRIPLCGDAGIR